MESGEQGSWEGIEGSRTSLAPSVVVGCRDSGHADRVFEEMPQKPGNSTAGCGRWEGKDAAFGRWLP